jgi:hypothetical protein
MPRKPPKENPLEGEVIDLDAQYSSYGGAKRVHEGRYIDPLSPLPGGVIKLVKDQRTKPSRGEKAASSAVYREYLQNLVRFSGDGVQALASTLGISLEKAEEGFPELHAGIIKNVAPRSIAEVLKENDLHKDVRIQILKSHAFGQVPAASLKALDMINQMDSVRSQDDSSYESYVRAVQEKKNLRG